MGNKENPHPMYIQHITTLFSILILHCATFSICAAQTKEEKKTIKKNVIFADASTPIVATATINYERHLQSFRSDNIHTYLRVGGGGIFIAMSGQGAGGYVGLTHLFKGPSHFFEVNTGVFIASFRKFEVNNPFQYDYKYEKIAFPLGSLGYRYHNNNGFVFRSYVGVLSLGGSVGFTF